MSGVNGCEIDVGEICYFNFGDVYGVVVDFVCDGFWCWLFVFVVVFDVLIFVWVGGVMVGVYDEFVIGFVFVDDGGYSGCGDDVIFFDYDFFYVVCSCDFDDDLCCFFVEVVFVVFEDDGIFLYIFFWDGVK